MTSTSICLWYDGQAEVDRLWDALTADGGQPSACGWLKDRWSLSWQIVPKQMIPMMSSKDRAAAKRAFEAMMTMTKIDIDIATTKAAFRGESDA